MGKDLKIKQSVSSPPYKVWGSFVTKKHCMVEETLLDNFLGGCFTWGLMIRPWKGERGFKGRVKLVFPLIDPGLG